MFKKLDKKTMSLLFLVLLISTFSSVILGLTFNDWASAVVMLAIGIISCFVLAQINLDKRFLQVVASKADKKNDDSRDRYESCITDVNENARNMDRVLRDQGMNLAEKIDTARDELGRRLSYELAYSQKQFSDDFRSMEGSHRKALNEIRLLVDTSAQRIDELQNKLPSFFQSSAFLEQASMGGRKPFQVGAPNIGNGTVARYGRGAAAVPSDPQRQDKLSNRMGTPKKDLIFYIGSTELKRFLEDQFEGDIVELFPNTAVHSINESLLTEAGKVRPLLIIDCSALSRGSWSSILSASGARLFDYLQSVIKELRIHEGFSFLLGDFVTKNTFTASLQNSVDIHVTHGGFVEEWSFDAKLSVPRSLQNYLTLESN